MGALNSVGAKVRKSNVHRSIKIGLGWVRLTKNLDQNRLVREEVRFAIKTIPPPSKKLPVAMYKISIVLCFVSFVNSQLK